MYNEATRTNATRKHVHPFRQRRAIESSAQRGRPLLDRRLARARPTHLCQTKTSLSPPKPDGDRKNPLLGPPDLLGPHVRGSALSGLHDSKVIPCAPPCPPW